LARRHTRRTTGKGNCDKDPVDYTGSRTGAAFRYVLGVMMSENGRSNNIDLLDVVALLDDDTANDLVRGQVGTVVELLDDQTVLVEFSDDQGRAYAIVPRARDKLLALRYEPQEA
jgi:Domain of unknown function (DUF4926)